MCLCLCGHQSCRCSGDSLCRSDYQALCLRYCWSSLTCDCFIPSGAHFVCKLSSLWAASAFVLSDEVDNLVAVCRVVPRQWNAYGGHKYMQRYKCLKMVWRWRIKFAAAFSLTWNRFCDVVRGVFNKDCLSFCTAICERCSESWSKVLTETGSLDLCYDLTALYESVYYYYYYPRESFREGLCNHRRTFVCLFICYHDN